MVIARIAIGLLHKSLEFGRLTDCLAKLPGNRVNNGPNMIETELDVIADPGEEGGSPLQAGSPLVLQGIRLILFDLDGTLVDSVGDLAWCGNTMLERLGLAVHMTAPMIHCGTGLGIITLEMFNHGPFDIEVTPGKTRICQLLLEEVSREPEERTDKNFIRQEDAQG